MDSLPLRLTPLQPDAPGDAGRSVLRWVAANPAWLANANAVGRPSPSNFLLSKFCCHIPLNFGQTPVSNTTAPTMV